MSRQHASELLAAYAGPAYLIAALLVGYSAIDYLGAIWPLNPSEVSWRYGSAGLLTGFALTPLLGMLLAILVATSAGQPRALRGASAVSIGLGVLFAIVLLGFGLDAIQLRRDAPEESRRLFDEGVAKAVVKHAGATWAWWWLGLRSWRAAARMNRGTSSDAGDLVVR